MSADPIKRSKLQEALGEGKFIINCEIDPSKGLGEDEIKKVA